MYPYFGVPAFRNFYDNMPYLGQGGMEWITKRGVFSTPLVIKMIPLRDMSRPNAETKYDDFDALVQNVRENLPIGSRVKAQNAVNDAVVTGQVSLVKNDYDERRVRIFVRDENSGEVVEVHPQSVYREMAVREHFQYVMPLKPVGTKPRATREV